MFKIGRATEEILSRALLLPSCRKDFDASLLVLDDKEFVVRGSHLLHIHAFTPNDYIYRLSKLLAGHGRLSAYLATEIIFAFHQTSNNALRFHRFMTVFLEMVATKGNVDFLESKNFVECFQDYCFSV